MPKVRRDGHSAGDQPDEAPRAKRGLASVGLRLAGAGLQLIVNLLLGRNLGAPAVGVYLALQSWSRLGAYVIALGLPSLTMKTVAATDLTSLRRSEEYVARWAKRVLALGLAVLGLWIGILAIVGVRDVGPALELAVLLVPVSALSFALTRLLAEALKARSRAELALSVEYSAVPVALLGALGVSKVTPFEFEETRMVITAIAAGGVGVLLLATAWIAPVLRRPVEIEPAAGSVRVPPSTLARFWATSVLEVLLWSAPFLVLPFTTGERELGLFGAAQRLVAVSTLIGVGLSSVYSPLFARVSAENRLDMLGVAHRKTAVMSGLCYLPFFIAFATLGSQILGIFGAEFSEAFPILVTMATGQLIGSWTGLSSEVLLMTGHERTELKITGATALLSLLGCAVGGASHGPLGVALGYTVALVLKRLLARLSVGAILRADAELQSGN